MQKTIRKEISFHGTGIHTGVDTEVTISPAECDHGIIFQTSGCKIPALYNFVSNTHHMISLSSELMYNGILESGNTFMSNETKARKALDSEQICIKTCEHLLSALYGLGITNALIKSEGPEIPTMDGSSYIFAREMEPELQNKEEKIIKIKKPIFIGNECGCIFATPSDEFKISFIIDYQHPGISTQFASFTIDSDTYLKEIAPARTYGFKNWIAKLKDAGLIQGGNIDNAIVFDNNGPINNLKFPDEPVRHKILDLIGDLALIGAKIQGTIVGIKSGHTLNTKLVKQIADNFIDKN